MTYITVLVTADMAAFKNGFLESVNANFQNLCFNHISSFTTRSLYNDYIFIYVFPLQKY